MPPQIILLPYLWNKRILFGIGFGLLLDLFLTNHQAIDLPSGISATLFLLSNSVLALSYLLKLENIGLVILLVLNIFLWVLIFYLCFSLTFKKTVIGFFILFLNILLPILFWQSQN